MTTQQAGQPTNTATPGDVRHQLERLYREIGISAVAAAVAQIRKPERAEPARQNDIPAWMREDAAAA